MLATNIAESSITIDDVVYVIDCGKAKETSYDALNKLACLLPSWISKASAHQVMFEVSESFHLSLLKITGLILSSCLMLPEERTCWSCTTWSLLPALPENYS